jgi:hypothetical protein
MGALCPFLSCQSTTCHCWSLSSPCPAIVGASSSSSCARIVVVVVCRSFNPSQSSPYRPVYTGVPSHATTVLPSPMVSTHLCSRRSVFTTYRCGLGWRSCWCPRPRRSCHRWRVRTVASPSPVTISLTRGPLLAVPLGRNWPWADLFRAGPVAE